MGWLELSGLTQRRNDFEKFDARPKNYRRFASQKLSSCFTDTGFSVGGWHPFINILKKNCEAGFARFELVMLGIKGMLV